MSCSHPLLLFLSASLFLLFCNPNPIPKPKPKPSLSPSFLLYLFPTKFMALPTFPSSSLSSINHSFPLLLFSVSFLPFLYSCLDI
ncbi:hypothetical protein IHE45_08G119800 [Dioscorea alata]|uniref:Uncharacterized protein n=1 Tax=Dioscorea alata TaxID=55571 RepID=A0ACB7VM11_DIOAL|nr:hypothetical protein IHE45_08G119800 [Dioscorea alata]